MSNSPKKPKSQEQTSTGKYISWIIFLFILARPLWGIIRSVAPSTISTQQIVMIVAGVVALGVVTVIATRARDSRSTTPRSLTSYEQPRSNPRTPDIYRSPSSTLPAPPRPTSSALPRPPTFEPVITGTVVLVGLVLAAIIGSIIAFIMVLTP